MIVLLIYPFNLSNVARLTLTKNTRHTAENYAKHGGGKPTKKKYTKR